MADKKKGLGMLLQQYRDSPNLKAYIQCFLDEFEELHEQFEWIVKYRYLADSFGQQVDDIADLVGATRVLYGAAALGYFGYYDNPAAESTGDDNNKSVGGFLRSDSDRATGDFVRTDEQLKGAIRARVIKMTTNCNIEDILTFCDLVLGRSLNMQITEGKLTMNFILHETLSVSDKVLLAYMLPDIKPGGVTITLRDNAGNIALAYSHNIFPVNVL